MISSHVRNDIDRLIAGELGPTQHRKMRDHIRDCGDCAQYYEEQRSVEDALFASAGMAPSAIERMQELVIEDLEPAKKKPQWTWSALAAFATAAAALVILVHKPNDEFTARGGANIARGAGLSLFAVDPATKSVRHLGDGGAASSPKTLRWRSPTATTSFDHAAVMAVDADNQITWLQNDVQLVHDAHQQSLPGAWTLSETPTTVRIFAVFSAKPIDHAQVEQALSKHSRRLDLSDAGAQDSLEVHID